jgi:tRNA uridine 5-carboxymethylaminomethyl modification enzyme
LPYEVQKAYIRTIKGFENAIITRPGYAIEYDFVAPNQLHHTLEVKSINGLFLAGQINGTTGYEEAAGQGLVAGINAHLKQSGKEPFILNRTESYIGVMIDDLVTMSVDEPYRMFTSRAERRLILRQDNSFLRLTDRAYQMGLIEQELYNDFLHEKEIISSTLQDLRTNYNNATLLKLFGDNETYAQQLREITGKSLSDRAVETIHAEIRYEPYLKREEKEIQKTHHFQELVIPEQFDYKNLSGLSKELQEKLARYKPQTIAAASLIPGMTPAAISLLIFRVREWGKTPCPSNPQMSC